MIVHYMFEHICFIKCLPKDTVKVLSICQVSLLTQWLPSSCYTPPRSQHDKAKANTTKLGEETHCPNGYGSCPSYISGLVGHDSNTRITWHDFALEKNDDSKPCRWNKLKSTGVIPGHLLLPIILMGLHCSFQDLVLAARWVSCVAMVSHNP